MSQDRESPTGQLIDVIQMIQLSRGTCQLKVKRGKGATAEEAYIGFVNGQLVEARNGHLTGVEAFNRISVWRECLVAFVSSNQANITSPVISLQHADHNHHEQIMGSSAPPFQAISPLRKRTASSLSPSTVPVPIKPLNISLQMIEQMGLSRIHRQLLLLVDGQRSCAELARLTVRKPEELEKVIRDLERIEILQLSGDK